MESHLEARLWNDVFVFAQEQLGIPRGTIRATVLIETILAAFEMDEILYELRDHSAGLNCGRWDYIFSFIKKFRNRPDFVLPDRATVTMETPFPEIVCGPADRDLPSPRHSRDGRDGGADSDQERSGSERDGARESARRTNCAKCVPDTMARGWRIPGWCRSPRKFSMHTCRQPNQIERQPRDVHVTCERSARGPDGEITEAGLRWNIDVGIQYLESWLRGIGLRSDLQPDGRRGYGGDLPRAGVAMGAARRCHE